MLYSPPLTGQPTSAASAAEHSQPAAINKVTQGWLFTVLFLTANGLGSDERTLCQATQDGYFNIDYGAPQAMSGHHIPPGS